MKYILLIFIAAIVYSCNSSSSFINHKLESKKIGDCTTGEKTVNMVSNIAGERYEFESCLDINFDGKNYTVERKGDSIVVNFPETNGPKAAFTITLDIDAKPLYNFMVIDGMEAIPIKQVE
ncbi:MAG: hypothetical protein IPP72_19780 [Chitinophagaceae bacterium]|nr:hypothetical protein [Chitinophagaceae bacterium]